MPASLIPDINVAVTNSFVAPGTFQHRGMSFQVAVSAQPSGELVVFADLNGKESLQVTIGQDRLTDLFRQSVRLMIEQALAEAADHYSDSLVLASSE